MTNLICPLIRRVLIIQSGLLHVSPKGNQLPRGLAGGRDGDTFSTGHCRDVDSPANQKGSPVTLTLTTKFTQKYCSHGTAWVIVGDNVLGHEEGCIRDLETILLSPND